MIISVVPPPISIKTTPNCFSLLSKTDEADANGSNIKPSNPIPTLSKHVFKFMNLKWSNELINFYKTAKKRDIIRTASYKQVIQPIYKSSLYKWKNYKSEIETIFPQVSKWIKYYNY